MSLKKKMMSRPGVLWERYRPGISKHAFSLTVAAVFSLLVVGLSYVKYLKLASDKDFAAVTAAIEHAYRETGVASIARNETCRHSAPGKFEGDRLYCSVELAGFLPYRSDNQAIAAAQTLEYKIDQFSNIEHGWLEFYKQPADNIGSMHVTFSKPLPDMKCTLSIASKGKAQDAANFLPKQTDANLIAFTTRCSVESREKYFQDGDKQSEKHAMESNALHEKDKRDISYQRHGVRIYTPAYVPHMLRADEITYDEHTETSTQNFRRSGRKTFSISCTGSAEHVKGYNQIARPEHIIGKTKSGANIYHYYGDYLIRLDGTYILLQEGDDPSPAYERLQSEMPAILNSLRPAN